MTSPPCKGFSGLVSEAKSGSAKYSALNGLTVRGIELALQAWKDEPPRFWLLENVPRLVTRGERLLAEIVAILEAADYSVSYTIPDLGVLGGLGQSRKRLHLVARHRERVPVFVFEPPRRSLRTVGDILGPLPMPEHPAGGFLHRLPRLSGKTWVRLALIPAGGDWRDLRKLEVVDGLVRGLAIEPLTRWYPQALGVLPWDEPAGTVTGKCLPHSGAFAAADPRFPEGVDLRGNAYKVTPWDEPAPTVVGQRSPGAGLGCVPDPRCPEAWGKYSQYGVMGWEQPAGTVTANGGVGGGRAAVVPDPRFPWDRADGAPYASGGHYGVTPWNSPSGAVTGGRYDNGPWSIDDPRVDGVRHNNVYRIVRWDEASVAITAGQTPTSGGASIGDPRSTTTWEGKGKYKVTPWNETAGTVIGAAATGNGAVAIGDPRFDWHPGASSSKYRVAEWDSVARTITGSTQVGSGAPAIADPRSPSILTEERSVLVIRALDGTWHRPMTVLERAALQGLVEPDGPGGLSRLGGWSLRDPGLRVGGERHPPAGDGRHAAGRGARHPPVPRGRDLDSVLHAGVGPALRSRCALPGRRRVSVRIIAESPYLGRPDRSEAVREEDFQGEVPEHLRPRRRKLTELAPSRSLSFEEVLRGTGEVISVHAPPRPIASVAVQKAPRKPWTASPAAKAERVAKMTRTLRRRLADLSPEELKARTEKASAAARESRAAKGRPDSPIGKRPTCIHGCNVPVARKGFQNGKTRWECSACGRSFSTAPNGEVLAARSERNLLNRGLVGAHRAYEIALEKNSPEKALFFAGGYLAAVIGWEAFDEVGAERLREMCREGSAT